MATERELKFSRAEERVPSQAELAPAFEGAGLELGAPRHVVQDDRYYDDARLSLSRAGLALRRRMVEGRVLAALKSAGAVEGALHQREEIELPVPDHATALEPWPETIGERVRTVTDPRGLVPVLELRTERVSFPVLRDGREVAQLAFDGVEARRPRAGGSVHFDELEVEAAEAAPPAELDTIAEALHGVLTLAASAHTKLARARALLMVLE